MSQDDDDKTGDGGEVLSYRPPREDKGEADKSRLPRALSRPGCLVIYAGIVLVTAVSISTTYGLAIGLVIAGTLLIGAIAQVRGIWRHRQSEEEVEREWEERQRVKSNIVEVARLAYAAGLFGKWRIAVIEKRGRNMTPLVHEERLFIFDRSGTGTYAWFKGLGSPPATIAFEHKLESDAVLLIRVTSPGQSDWVAVDYFFEAQLDNYGELELALCLESGQPIGGNLGPPWPFEGAFHRVVER